MLKRQESHTLNSLSHERLQKLLQETEAIYLYPNQPSLPSPASLSHSGPLPEKFQQGSSLALTLCYSKCIHGTAGLGFTWEVAKNAESWVPSRPTEPEPVFPQDLQGFSFILEIGEQAFRWHPCGRATQSCISSSWKC